MSVQPLPTPDPAPVDPIPPAPPPPWWSQQTFYLTASSYVLPLLTLLLHKDVTAAGQAIAMALAGIATAVYTIKVYLEHRDHRNAVTYYNNMLTTRQSIEAQVKMHAAPSRRNGG